MPLRWFAQIPVRKAGYQWSSSARLAQLVAHDLSAGDVDRETSDQVTEKFRSYDPFSAEPALFRLFAALDLGEIPQDSLLPSDTPRLRNTIRKFTDKYGLIAIAEANTLDKFSWEVLTMRAAVKLWEAIRSEKPSALKEFLPWEGMDQMKNCEKSLGKILNNTIAHLKAANLEVPPWFTKKNFANDSWKRCLVKSALAVILAQVEPAQWIPTPPGKKDVLLWANLLLCALIQEKTKGDLKIEPYQPARGPMILRIQTNDLLTALWLQLAIAVSENKDYRECRRCRRPFELAPKTTNRQGRSDKSYCSATCRVQAMVERKKLVKEMFAQGKKVSAIAKEVGSSEEIVKKWVAKDSETKPKASKYAKIPRVTGL